MENFKNIRKTYINEVTKNFKQSLGDLLLLFKFPLLTSNDLTKNIFLVDKSMTKTEIKYVFKEIFNKKIKKINTSILPVKTKHIGKFRGKKSCYKKISIQFN